MKVKRIVEEKQTWANQCKATTDSRKARVLAHYRKVAGLKDDELITEENLNDYAFNHTSCYQNYDKDKLRKLLLGGRHEG